MQENPFWRFNTEALKDLRMLQWELDHLPDFLYLLLQAANILVGDLWDSLFYYLYCLWIIRNISAVSHHG